MKEIDKVYVIIGSDKNCSTEYEKVLCMSIKNNLYKNIMNCLMVNGVHRQAAVEQTEKILEDEDDMQLQSVYADMDEDGYGYDYSSEIDGLTIRIEEYELNDCLRYY